MCNGYGLNVMCTYSDKSYHMQKSDLKAIVARCLRLKLQVAETKEGSVLRNIVLWHVVLLCVCACVYKIISESLVLVHVLLL